MNGPSERESTQGYNSHRASEELWFTINGDCWKTKKLPYFSLVSKSFGYKVELKH